MKRILFVAFLLVIGIASLFAEGTAGDILDKIPAWLSLPFAVLIAFGGPILKLVGIGGGILSVLVKGMRKNFVTYERVDKIVEVLLTTVGVPLLFADWVGDVIAKILVEAPQLLEASVEQKADVVASSFADLPVPKATNLLATKNNVAVPPNVMKVKFARKRIASQLAAFVIEPTSV
jgi:hypothetical protein